MTIPRRATTPRGSKGSKLYRLRSHAGDETMHTFLIWAGAGASFASAVFWARSASITVPNNIDTLVGELQRYRTLERMGRCGVMHRRKLVRP